MGFGRRSKKHYGKNYGRKRNVKTWIKVLVIGIALDFIGMMMLGYSVRLNQIQYLQYAWILFLIGIPLTIGAIIAAATRLFRKMVND